MLFYSNYVKNEWVQRRNESKLRGSYVNKKYFKETKDTVTQKSTQESKEQC